MTSVWLLTVSVFSILVAVLGVVCNVAAPEPGSPVDVHGRLRVSGTQIIDTQNRSVRLRGVSLGPPARFGTRYWNADVVNWLADDWKVSVIRAPIDNYITDAQTARLLTSRVVTAAGAKGVYVILDWHYHDAHLHKAKAHDFFLEMASAWGQCEHVMYELWSEPIFWGSTCPSTVTASLCPLYNAYSWENVILPYHWALIRDVFWKRTSNILIVGTRSYDRLQDVGVTAKGINQTRLDNHNGIHLSPTMRPVRDFIFSTVVYALHFYAPRDRGALRILAEQVISEGIPVMVTEWGTCENSTLTGGLTCVTSTTTVTTTCGTSGMCDKGSGNQWMAWMSKYRISDINWVIADADMACSALKLNASKYGQWDVINDLTESGRFARQHILQDYHVIPTTSGTTTTTTTTTLEAFQCPLDVLVTGAESMQLNRMGTFSKAIGIAYEQRPVYSKVTNGAYEFLYYWPQMQQWQIGSSYLQSRCGLQSVNGVSAECPTDVTTWNVATLTGWTVVELSVTDLNVTTTLPTLQATSNTYRLVASSMTIALMQLWR